MGREIKMVEKRFTDLFVFVVALRSVKCPWKRFASLFPVSALKSSDLA